MGVNNTEYNFLEVGQAYYEIQWVINEMMLKLLDLQIADKKNEIIRDYTEAEKKIDIIRTAQSMLYSINDSLRIEKKRNCDLEFINIKHLKEIEDLKEEILKLNREKNF